MFSKNTCICHKEHFSTLVLNVKTYFKRKYTRNSKSGITIFRFPRHIWKDWSPTHKINTYFTVALKLTKNNPNTYHSELIAYTIPHDQGKTTSGFIVYSASMRFSWKSQSPHSWVKPDAQWLTEGICFSKAAFWRFSYT